MSTRTDAVGVETDGSRFAVDRAEALRSRLAAKHARGGASGDDARIYPCDTCDKMRTKAEGGTVFTVCEACWDRHYAQRTPTDSSLPTEASNE